MADNANRSALVPQPNLYIGDLTGRPLDYGMVYFGEPNKDPEFYPIEIFADQDLTVPLAQPVRTKGGYLYDKGDVVRVFSVYGEYSVKVKDQYSREVYYVAKLAKASIGEIAQDQADYLRGVINTKVSELNIVIDLLIKNKIKSSYVYDGEKTQEQINSEQAQLNNVLSAFRTTQQQINVAQISTNEAQAQTNALLQSNINSVSGGYFKAFDTLSNLNAATGMTTGQVAKVMGDTSVNNGDYYYNGSSWVKGYDSLSDAKAYVDANPMFKKVQLKDGDDLNNIVKSGVYYNSSDLTATQLKNMPELYGNNTVLGTLVVYSVYDAATTAIHQIFYPHTGNHSYSRSTNTSGIFGAWEKSISGSELSQVLNKTQVQMLTLEQAQTLDVLTMAAGLYSWNDFPQGRAIANMPPVTYPYGLLEIKNTASALGGQYRQATFYPYGRHKEFWVNKNHEEGWTGWMRYVDADTLKAEIASAGTAYVPTVVMPPKIYALSGLETHIYPEHLVIDEITLYNSKVTAPKGKHKNRGYVWSPTTADSAGQYDLSWALHDKQTATELATASTKIILVDKNKDSGVTKKVMVIGDSYINNGAITQQILDIANNDVTKVQLIGTRGDGANKHEGRSGWRISDYATAGRTYVKFSVSGVTTPPTWNTATYTYNDVTFTILETAITNGSGTITAEYFGGSLTDGASGTLTKTNNSAGDATINFSNLQKLSGNPFWYNGQVDFAHHLTANSLATPDIVLIELGVNDCFGQTTDDGVVSLTATAFSQLDTLIASIKAANSNVKIGLCLSPKYADQDAFGIDYGASFTTWRCSRNIAIWNRELIKRYKDSEPQNIYVVASGFNVDTLNNYPTTQEPINSHNSTLIDVQNNSVHPYPKGYQQIGDAMFVFIKAI